MIRRFREEDAVIVDALYAACHPGWPPKKAGFWWAHPTLVLEHEGELLGATSFTLAPAPSPQLYKVVHHSNAEVGWGHGVYVAPDAQGNGYGWRLAQARHRALKNLGIVFFLGLTQPTNHAMIRIFDKQQLTRHATIPDMYPDGGPGVMYVGGVI